MLTFRESGHGVFRDALYYFSNTFVNQNIKKKKKKKTRTFHRGAHGAGRGGIPGIIPEWSFKGSAYNTSMKNITVGRFQCDFMHLSLWHLSEYYIGPCDCVQSTFKRIIYGCVGSSLLQRLSLVAVSGGYSLLAVRGLFIAVASRCRMWA